MTGVSEPTGRGESDDTFSRTTPFTVPKAQFSALIVTAISAVSGTLTVAGAKP